MYQVLHVSSPLENIAFIEDYSEKKYYLPYFSNSILVINIILYILVYPLPHFILITLLRMVLISTIVLLMLYGFFPGEMCILIYPSRASMNGSPEKLFCQSPL